LPYTGNDPNLIDLQNQVTALKGRLDALDGQGLADPALAWSTVQAKKIAGLTTDLRQMTMVIQQKINTLQTSVDALTALRNFTYQGSFWWVQTKLRARGRAALATGECCRRAELGERALDRRVRKANPRITGRAGAITYI
jgi:hypothetical protein